MAQPQDALHFREIMGRMFARRSMESRSQAFLVAPITIDQPRAEREQIMDLVRLSMWGQIEYGDVFYVSPEITQLMVRMADDLLTHARPFHFQPEDFPTLSGFVYFDGLIEIPTAYPEHWAPPTALDTLRALSWGQLSAADDDGKAQIVGKIVYSYVDKRHLQAQIDFASPWIARHWIPMHYGRPHIPRNVFRRESINEFEREELTDEQIDRLMERQNQASEKISAILYVWTQFLKTEYFSTPRTEIPNNHVKLMKREGRPLPPFRTVVLRRAVSIGEKPVGMTEVEWSHRWKVRAHWRNQRVGPGKQMIRPTLVMEHWKGPEDKPMDLRPTVQAVVR